jgi:hypothetical protein
MKKGVMADDRDAPVISHDESHMDRSIIADLPDERQTPEAGLVRFSLGALLFFGRADYESALGSPVSEPDSQSGGFYNACPNFETHPGWLGGAQVW